MMGKDQRSKTHGLDVRKNRKLKAQRDAAYKTPTKPPKQHKGQR